MDLTSVVDELYGLPLGAFVATRTERAKQARSDGDRELAAQIAKLPKPSTAAWAVNLLARNAPAELARVLDVGAALRRAQHDLDGAELRELTRQRQSLITELVRRARAAAHDAGLSLGDTIVEEVEQTLRAAMANPAAADDVRGGHLATALTPVGGLTSAAFGGSWAGTPGSSTSIDRAGGGAPAGPPPPAPAPQGSAQDTTQATALKSKAAAAEASRRRERELATLLDAAEEAERRAVEAEQCLAAPEAQLDEATDRREDVRRSVEQLASTLRERTAELGVAEAELAAAQVRLAAAQMTARQAREAAEAASQQHSQLSGAT